jgi:putative endonuclease
MFYVYVLKSQKTGRRYVGSCEDLDDRLSRHNNSESKATRHGVPWFLLHSEKCSAGSKAVARERYYKTGKGRDELDQLEAERSPRRQVAGSNPVTPILHQDYRGRSSRRLIPMALGRMRIKINALVISAVIGGIALTSRAQDAAPPSVDFDLRKNEQNVPAPAPVSPNIPELSQLDQVFKKTSLGKEADERRLHVEWRHLANQATNDPNVVAAKSVVHSARTDLEKRQLLREYYNIYYGRMRASAATAEMKAALDELKAAHLSHINQPRVRPATDGALPTPTPEEHKHKDKKKKP